MAKRSVSVGLTLDAGQYKTEATVVEAKTKGVDDAVQDLDRDITKIPPDAAKAAAAMKLLGGDADGLRGKLSDVGPEATTSMQLIDKQIDETRAKMKQFAADFNQTGSADSFNLWKSATRDLGDLETLKKQLSGALEDGAKEAEKALEGSVSKGTKDGGDNGIAGMLKDIPKIGNALATALSNGAVEAEGGLAKAFSALPPEAQLAIGIGIIAAIDASAAGIGAALNGALLAGVGLGGIGLGIAGQISNPVVKGALSRLKEEASGDLTTAAGAFGPVLVDVLRKAETEIDKLEPGLARMFNTIAPDADRLLSAFIQLADEAAPGFEHAVEASRPVLDELAKDVPDLGNAFRIFFNLIASGSQGGADALGDLIKVIEFLVEATGAEVDLLSKMFTAMEITFDLATGKFTDAAVKIAGLSNSSKDGADAAKALTTQLGQAGVAGAADDAAGALGQLDDAALEWDNLALDAKSDSLSFRDAVTSMTDALKQSKKGFNDNTAAGRASEEAYLAGVKAAQEHAAAVYQSTGSAVAAAQAYAKDKAQLDAAAKSAGATSKQIQALNAQLDNAVKVRVGTTTITVRVQGNGANLVENQGTYLIQGSGRKYNRWGGIYTHAADGLLSQADTYSATNPGRYMIAEPQTGGEAFIPRNGDYARSTAILDQAARWYGGRFAPGGGAAPNININAMQMDEDRIAALVGRRLAAAGLR